MRRDPGPVRLYPGAYVVRKGEDPSRPRKAWRDKRRPELFHVGPDLYHGDGTPVEPGQHVIGIDFVFRPGS